MTDAAIAADIHQALNVHLNFRAEVTLNLEIAADNLTDLCRLIICPVFYFDTAIYTSRVQYLASTAATYTIDISQSDFPSLILGQIYTNDSYCHIMI